MVFRAVQHNKLPGLKYTAFLSDWVLKRGIIAQDQAEIGNLVRKMARTSALKGSI